MTANILAAPYSQFIDSNGAPLAGGKIYTYAAGTDTPQAAYSDSGAGTPLTNPIILDSAGRAQIWLSGAYKIVVKDSLGNIIQTTDNVNSSSSTLGSLSVTADASVGGNFSVTGISTLTGGGTTATVAAGDNSTNIASTAWVRGEMGIVQPQGRLSLSSTLPVSTSDLTAQGTIYYLPFIGNYIPIWNGSEFIHTAITSGLSLVLDTTHQTASKTFDVYASLVSGVLTLSAMAWGSTSARSTTLGGYTGAANASVVQKNGLWVNNTAIGNGDAFGNNIGVAISQYQGTLLGTFYTTANGQTGMALFPAAAAGGAANILGLWNTYNRVKITARCLDNTSSWNYTTGSWRNADNSASNRISWVDGLGQSFIDADYTVGMVASSTSVVGIAGVNLNSTSTPAVYNTSGQQTSISSSIGMMLAAKISGYPTLGLNFVQAMEFGATTITFYGGTANYQATLRCYLMM